MYVDGGKPWNAADGVVVRALHVWELLVPVGLLFFDHHGEHQSHRMIDALDTAVGPSTTTHQKKRIGMLSVRVIHK